MGDLKKEAHEEMDPHGRQEFKEFRKLLPGRHRAPHAARICPGIRDQLYAFKPHVKPGSNCKAVKEYIKNHGRTHVNGNIKSSLGILRI